MFLKVFEESLTTAHMTAFSNRAQVLRWPPAHLLISPPSSQVYSYSAIVWLSIFLQDYTFYDSKDQPVSPIIKCPAFMLNINRSKSICVDRNRVLQLLKTDKHSPQTENLQAFLKTFTFCSLHVVREATVGSSTWEQNDSGGGGELIK